MVRCRVGIIWTLLAGVALASPLGAQEPSLAKPVPSNSKKWSYAWPPEKKPLRGIILQEWPGLLDGGVVKGLKPNPWQDFLERNGIAWCDGTLDVRLLPEIATELRRPELANAPVILTGLSSPTFLGRHQLADLRFDLQHADRQRTLDFDARL